jgi:hypothetical protein
MGREGSCIRAPHYDTSRGFASAAIILQMERYVAEGWRSMRCRIWIRRRNVLGDSGSCGAAR